MDDESKSDKVSTGPRTPEGIEVFEVRGPLFFGVTSTFLDTVQQIKKKPKIRILRMRHVLSIDATALLAIRQVYQESKKEGIYFLIADLHSQALMAMEKSGLLEEIGIENVSGTLKQTMKRAREMLAAMPH